MSEEYIKTSVDIDEHIKLVNELEELKGKYKRLVRANEDRCAHLKNEIHDNNELSRALKTERAKIQMLKEALEYIAMPNSVHLADVSSIADGTRFKTANDTLKKLEDMDE